MSFLGFDFGQSSQKLLYGVCESEADWRSKQHSRLNEFLVNTVFTRDRQTAAQRQLMQNKHGKLDSKMSVVAGHDSL